jgi:rhombotail lipoprotein
MNLLHGARVGSTFVLVASMLLGGGCAAFFGLSSNKAHRSSSVVAYLYPGKADPLPPTTIPVLRLPLRVGVAFVPSGGRGNRDGDYSYGSGLTEVQKTGLMRRVADEFKGRDYIQSIELIPSSYLRPGGGFENLNQVRGLLGVDVVALIAYDQVQFTNENFLSLSYWTIVGAYIFHGNKNDTQTLMEAAVYDIPSRHLLFRAPGANQVTAGSAAVYVQDNLRTDSAKSFDAATTVLIGNLKAQLEDFRERVKRSPGEVQIERRPGYTGGGSFGPAFVGALALLFGVLRWRRTR